MPDTKTKAWPRRKVLIPDYNWEIVFFDPTVEELEQIDEARKKTPPDFNKVKEIVAGLIEKWDCLDRKDAPLPISAGSFGKLPPIVQHMLLKGLTSRVESADPKEDTASSPATPPEVEATKQETPPAL